MRSLRLVLSAALTFLPVSRGLVSAGDNSASLATIENMAADSSLVPTAMEGSGRFSGNLVYAGQGGKFASRAAPEGTAPQTTPRPSPKGPTVVPPPGESGATAPPVSSEDKKAKAEGGDKKGGEKKESPLANPAVGAAVGLLAGAAIGFLVGGPIGACVGACAGALIGALVSNMMKKKEGGDAGGEKK